MKVHVWQQLKLLNLKVYILIFPDKHKQKRMFLTNLPGLPT